MDGTGNCQNLQARSIATYALLSNLPVVASWSDS